MNANDSENDSYLREDRCFLLLYRVQSSHSKLLLQLTNGRLAVTSGVTDNDYHSTLIPSKIHARNGCQVI